MRNVRFVGQIVNLRRTVNPPAVLRSEPQRCSSGSRGRRIANPLQINNLPHKALRFFASLALAGSALGQPNYDLLLQGGHLIDAKNGISAIRDVAIKDGTVAAVAAHLDPASALKVVNVSGFCVTPGLVDIHLPLYAGTTY